MHNNQIKIQKEKKYYHAFNCISGVGAITLKKIIDYFGSAEEAWKARDEEILKINFRNSIGKSIIEFRRNIDVEANYDALIKDKIKLIIILEENYPSLLKEIYDPPLLLYYQGEIDFINSIFFGVVGTRKLTPYGKRAIEEIVSQLVFNDLAIVSGMARGGDTVAHETCIANNGKTVAVLGSGLKKIYPSENKKLFQKITENGVVISEFPPERDALKQNFPMRNRIISGLCVGLLVVEATEKSGTLITANCALEQNREVFALPGSIFNPYSKGPAQLIKMGAKMVTSVEDILEELNIEKKIFEQKSKNIIPDSDNEKRIRDVLKLHDYVMIDELVRETGIKAGEVLSTLTMMEMKGKIKNLGANKYSL